MTILEGLAARGATTGEFWQEWEASEAALQHQGGACRLCGKTGSARQSFEHQGLRLCYWCALARAAVLATEGHEDGCDCPPCELRRAGGAA